MKSLILTIESISEWTGRAASWLVLALVLLICYDVSMRALFNQGSIGRQELEWHLFALIFLLGAAYTLKHDQHVRVDIIYQSRFLSDKSRAWINLLGSLILLLPFCAVVLFSSWPFVESAFYYQERSANPDGLPYRFLLKGSLLVAFSLIFLQGIANMLRSILILRQQEMK
ncbi:MAG: C4-dicarboxylate ABC transporter permease [Gammaproteobacteria bacterium]|nr:MAG: C4-dicarboxylate ABC transporter permease [Gammaproteobacteria bacterium]